MRRCWDYTAAPTRVFRSMRSSACARRSSPSARTSSRRSTSTKACRTPSTPITARATARKPQTTAGSACSPGSGRTGWPEHSSVSKNGSLGPCRIPNRAILARARLTGGIASQSLYGGTNMTTLTPRSVAATLAAFTLGFSAAAMADNDRNDGDRFSARLSGYNEVHFIAAPPALRGAISTKARGSFRAMIDDRAQRIDYELSFEGLESDVTQAHIHFGQRHTVGGIVVWLCQTAGTPAPAAVAALTPLCGGPRASTVTGMITPAQVITATGQGIDAREFDDVVRAIRAGRVYANVHSTLFPPGEIRGQLRGGDGGHHDHD